jgi:hypothetical protein
MSKLNFKSVKKYPTIVFNKRNDSGNDKGAVLPLIDGPNVGAPELETPFSDPLLAKTKKYPQIKFNKDNKSGNDKSAVKPLKNKVKKADLEPTSSGSYHVEFRQTDSGGSWDEDYSSIEEMKTGISQCLTEDFADEIAITGPGIDETWINQSSEDSYGAVWAKVMTPMWES